MSIQSAGIMWDGFVIGGGALDLLALLVYMASPPCILSGSYTV